MGWTARMLLVHAKQTWDDELEVECFKLSIIMTGGRVSALKVFWQPGATVLAGYSDRQVRSHTWKNLDESTCGRCLRKINPWGYEQTTCTFYHKPGGAVKCQFHQIVRQLDLAGEQWHNFETRPAEVQHTSIVLAKRVRYNYRRSERETNPCANC
jgi:hypothetical protein